MASPKWKINNLKGSLSFEKASELILKARIKKLVFLVKVYLQNETPQGLHDLRISLRRLRFNMELFYNIYDRKKFIKFYDLLVNIQDATGSVRDIYIINENISLFKQENKITLPDSLGLIMEEKQKKFLNDLRTDLNSFINSAELKYFQKLLK